MRVAKRGARWAEWTAVSTAGTMGASWAATSGDRGVAPTGVKMAASSVA